MIVGHISLQWSRDVGLSKHKKQIYMLGMPFLPKVNTISANVSPPPQKNLCLLKWFKKKHRNTPAIIPHKHKIIHEICVFFFFMLSPLVISQSTKWFPIIWVLAQSYWLLLYFVIFLNFYLFYRFQLERMEEWRCQAQYLGLSHQQ